MISTGDSTEMQEFYDELTTPVDRSSNTAVLADDFNEQVRELNVLEAYLGGRGTLCIYRTNNRDRIFQFCANNWLFLSSLCLSSSWDSGRSGISSDTSMGCG